MTFRRLLYEHRNFLIIYITPFVILPLPLLVTDQKGTCGYMLLLMGVYWCTECLPLAVTGLIPVFLAPMFGLLTTVQVCENYLKDSTMMFTGGLMVAIALEKSNLHRRIAINVLRMVGSEPKWLMFGFMLPTWFLSMWISNTATTAMMLPILEAVLQQLRSTHGRPPNKAPRKSLEENAYENEACSEVPVEKWKGKNLKPEHKRDGDLELTSFKVVQLTDEEKGVPNGVSNGDVQMHYETVEDVSTKKEEGQQNEADDDEETEEFKHLCRGMTLAVAYAANVGGTATLTGTTPNTIMKGAADQIWQEQGYAESPVTYTSWLIYGFPQACMNLVLVYLWLRLLYLGLSSFKCTKSMDEEQEEAVKKVIKREYNALGPIRYNEWMVGTLFVILVLLWFFRSPGFMEGWGDQFKPGYIGDAVPAILIACILFCIPNAFPRSKNTGHTDTADALLDWPIVHKKYPWSIIFLMGGGFALAEACEVSGLSEWIGEQLAVFGDLPGWLMVAIVCFLVAMLTEVTSNSATCTILMPIMASMAEALDQNPLYLMMPVAIATSFAFMLPVATPPNAIAFSYGRITVMDMVKAGSLLNLLCVFTVTLATHTWAYDYFDYGTIPWDTSPTTENVTSLPVYCITGIPDVTV